MKKLLFVSTLAFIMSITFYGCSKSSTSNNNNPGGGSVASTQWTFDGTAYTESSSDLIAAALYGYDTLYNYVSIDFGAVPTANASYGIVGNGYANGKNCSFLVATNGGTHPYYSTAQSGTVTVTFSSGKITAKFSNVSITDLSTTHTLSGTIVEQ